MAEPIIQPKWKTVEYSRSQIIKAGKTIRKEDVSDADREAAIAVIDNWRAAHAFPLHVIYMHLRRMASGHPEIIVAERLKRLDSILNKLKREPSMSLWTMQDLGGCRFVVPAIEDVYLYSEQYDKSKKRHILLDRYDYINQPKQSGYRSLHLVYKYYSDKNETYNNNMLIELQFRTHLQHLWATAVETMGLFTKEAIKSGEGSEDVKRFFALVSSLFALIENQPMVPGTPADYDDIVNEIEELNSRNNYLDFLSNIRVVSGFEEELKKSSPKSKIGYYIMILNNEKHSLRILPFYASAIEEANDVYNSVERSMKDTNLDAVLVRVSSIDMLRKAYPNYFMDIEEFVTIVKSHLA